MTTEMVLDQGYLTVVESWGGDDRIIEAARMSTRKGFAGWGPIECTYRASEEATAGGDNHANCSKCKGSGRLEGDEKLLRFLWEHKHHTPFEMAGLVIEVQAPIFVFREWHRHRTQSYNELSARYVTLPDMTYMPTLERLRNAAQASANKQGSTAGLSEEAAVAAQATIESAFQHCRMAYELLLSSGVAREVARIVTPVAQYSRMRAAANLRNWLAFLTLRMDPAAQWEIRQYADALGRVIADRFPRTWELFRSA